jgi:cell division protein FtsI (penicillin-binding protein 3)
VADTANAWRATLKSRIVVAAAGLFLWSTAIEARLVYLQVYRHADLVARAERQQLRTVAASGKRGEIRDRRGHVLAYSVDADSIYAVPTEIADADQASASLCTALADCSSADRQSLAERIRRGRAFVYVRRQVTPDQARRVADLQLEGVGFMKENRRFYPNKDLAAHLLGYVGLDNNGLAGLEATYDNLIKGHPGTVLIQTDAKRHAFSRVERPSTRGADLELTIDEYLQHIAERELQAGIEYAGAEGGSAIVMDPYTAEILALASYPTFNPNAYRNFDDAQRRNRAIQDLYEPGSTFKIVTASAALEQKILKPMDLVDTDPGVIRFGSRVVDEDKHHNYGVLTFTDVIVKSSNVGAIKVGLRVGAERMGLYARRFGFGRASSPDFPAESPGILWDPVKQTESALASMSMGYQVGVTPLQMAAAVSSVANGGDLVQPRVVRAVTRDGVRKPVPRKLLAHAIDRDTAADVAAIMEAVVERGTGRAAQIDGYTIAGKTGTAQKVENGRYSNTDYNVSFVGFVPSRKPVFTIVVVIDSPHKVPPYGATVAAPIFKRIASAALRQYGVPPTMNAAPPVLAVHQDTTDPVDFARSESTSTADVTPNIVTVDGGASGKEAVFPDLRGLSARDALRTLAKLGMTARMNGAGIVVRQLPQAGASIERETVATLWLARLRVEATAGHEQQLAVAP